MDDFLHGVETIKAASDIGDISTVKTSVIGLVGTSATGDINKLKLCMSSTDDAQFGSVASTGTIAPSLRDIRKQHPTAWVFVINLSATDTVVQSDFDGKVNVDGTKTGIKLFEDCKMLYGFDPKIFISPKYCETATISKSLRDLATKYGGITYLDCDDPMTYSTALTSRGGSGFFNFSDDGTKIFFPKVYDMEGVKRGYSAFGAGLRSKIDNDPQKGFWWSSSNNNVEGISKLAVSISWDLSQKDCEANKLNENGITTIVNVYGSGFREWGNRSSAFPTDKTASSFLCVKRVEDITSESIEKASLQFIDRPMTQAQIDLVTNTVCGYFNSLIARGALLTGSTCVFEKSRNTVAEMKKGHYVWTKVFMPPVPGERITYLSKLDTNLLQTLIA